MTIPLPHPSTGRPIVRPTGSARRPKAARHARMLAATGILVTVALCVIVTRSHDASADAGFASGQRSVTTNGFTHPWLGGYATDVGVA